MNIFEFGPLVAIGVFVLQLMMCLTAEKTWVKCLPLMAVGTYAAVMLVVLMMAAGKSTWTGLGIFYMVLYAMLWLVCIGAAWDIAGLLRLCCTGKNHGLRKMNHI